MLKLLITGSGSQLQGVARAPDGRTVFVPGALPGERVEAEVVCEKPRFLTARLIRVALPSARRVRPACGHAAACGGCAAMHMDYALTLELKRQKVADAFARLGGLTADVRETIGMPDPMRTRNKAEYAIAHGRIGCVEAGSRRVVEVDDCLSQREESVRAMRAARAWLGEGGRDFAGYLVTRVNRAGELMCVLSTDRDVDAGELPQRLFQSVRGMKSFYLCRLNPRPTHALDGRCRLIAGDEALTETLMGLTFRLSPQSFFQVNTDGAETLYGAALDAAGLLGGETALDAYCGTGTITLAMAKRAAKAVGVELSGGAIRDAKANAALNNLVHKTEFYAADAARWLPDAFARGFVPDVLCVDPPRRGVDAALIAAVRKAAPPRVVYVSCDPATLARDIKRLCEGGSYELAYAQPVDMFPWTHHVETVVLLSHRKPDSHINVKVEFGEGEGKVPLDKIAERAEA